MNSSADFSCKLSELKFKTFVCYNLLSNAFTNIKYFESLIFSCASFDLRIYKVLRNSFEYPIDISSASKSLSVAIFYPSFSSVLVRRDLILNLPYDAAF